jgi:hypothetical protein
MYQKERMSSLSINRMTHIRDDMCGIQSYYTQSVGPGRYTTTNLTPAARDVNPMAIENHMVYPREGYGVNNAAIDTDSAIRNHPVFKNNRCMIRPQARPFATVPYMGGGRGNADVESMLLHSQQVRVGKECGTVTEQAFDGVFTPMVPSLERNIQNPANLIPEVAAEGWIRGGLPSRLYNRDLNQ